MRNYSTRTVAYIVAGAVAAWITSAGAQDYPSKPIRVLTATGAGGTSDVFMRVLGDEYQKRHGQPIIVENRPGGSMNIGGRACAESPNDGYTICNLPAETLVHNQFLFKKLPYDPDKDFVPITNPFFNTQVLVVSSNLNVNTLQELAAYSKSKPGTLSYTAPAMSMAVFMERWKAATGADLVRVPFKGGGEAVNSMLSGSTQVHFFGILNWITHIQSGSVKALAVDGDQRSPLLPDVPTLRELGAEALSRVYFGVVAPAGTPKAIIDKLHRQITEIGNDPEFRRKRVIEAGLEPIFDTPEEFAQFLQEDRVRSERIVRESGQTPQ
jgi:tripartite-type tricarboxylate transporter receptor subunit TctC